MNSSPPLGMHIVWVTMNQSLFQPNTSEDCCCWKNTKQEYYVCQLELYKIKAKYKPNMKLEYKSEGQFVIVVKCQVRNQGDVSSSSALGAKAAG